MGLNTSWRFIIFSNLLIAMAAASQSLLTYHLLHIPFNLYIILLEWSATLLLYNFSMWLSMPKMQNNSPYLRTSWYFENRLIFMFLSLFALVIFIFSLLQLHSYTFLYLIFIGILSFGYALPIIKVNGKAMSFRQMAGVKVFLIALVWSLSTVGMPTVEYFSTGGIVEWAYVGYWGLLVFLFILAITIPFDIRDLKQDKYYNLQTIPVILGGARAKLLCYSLLFLHTMLVIVLFGITQPAIWTLIFTDIVVFIVLYKIIFRPRANYQQVYILDLILIIQFLQYYIIADL
ncbi:UbiA prenyltransferase family protein [Sphingobacterium rhinopitheci]|uniref:hypothetical protein n=1 Tax=Sphingobacterium rhinopitheci TaxID=2781960 RepID=UPI001F51A31D|nr:hypothetical protein [Sphingobacterium rhinopitheci]MCI0921609.1 hypothetical protein [Sphingobacterium rhinopitheci]